MIKIRKVQVEPTDVYDITVEDTHCFFANNIDLTMFVVLAIEFLFVSTISFLINVEYMFFDQTSISLCF